MSRILDSVYVNIPYTMLKEGYLSLFLERRINPEIGFDADALDSISWTECRDIAGKIHDHSLRLTLHGPFLDLSPGSPDPAVRELTRKRFEQLVRAAEFFHPSLIVCHAGYDWKRYSHLRDVWIENSLSTWKWLAEMTAGVGAVLMLENVYERGPEEMASLFAALASRGVGFCLDTGHQAAFGSTPLVEWVDALGPYLGQLHLHDNLGRWDDHLALGQGNINFEGLFRALPKILERPPTVTLEPHREADLQPSLEYLEEKWPWHQVA
jgi:sugar phosphate isomerase/epimerase